MDPSLQSGATVNIGQSFAAHKPHLQIGETLMTLTNNDAQYYYSCPSRHRRKDCDNARRSPTLPIKQALFPSMR